MKKILQINTVNNYGSVGKITEELGIRIINENWKSFIAYSRYNRFSSSNLIKIGNKFNLLINVLCTRLFDLHGFGSRIATKKLIKRIIDEKPDIIHLHNLHGYYINVKLLFEYLNSVSIPVVWTLHDCWSFTGHCTHFEYVNCNKWQYECKKCPQTREYPSSFFMDRSKRNYILKKRLFSYRKNIFIVTPSGWLSNIVRNSFFKSNTIRVVNNGIDLNVFNSSSNKSKLNFLEKYSIKTKYIILGCASVWTERKGLFDFFELNNIMSNDITIILVGLSTKQITKLPPGIIGINRTENVNELVDLYSFADVFVNPTYEDTFPTTNIESLACGTPVVTYNSGGSVEILDKTTGIVVNKNSILELNNAIEYIISNKNEFNEFNCRNRAEKYFDKNIMFEQYMSLYQKILE